MKEFKAYESKWAMDVSGAWVSLRVDSPSIARSICQAFENAKYLPYTILIKKFGKRSLDANAYLWVLCQKIGEAIHNTKEVVYKEMVSRAGQFILIPVREDALEAFIRHWEAQGTGWPAWVEDNSKLPGYKRVMCCFGSSVYNTREMSVLLNEVVDSARELGIETLPPHKLQEMAEDWEKRQKGKGLR